MRNFIKKNLKDDVEDGAKSRGVKGREMHHANAALKLTASGLSYQKLAPKHRITFGHHHGEQEEVYIVIDGSGRMKLDDEIIDLKKLDAVRVAGNVVRAVEAGVNGIEYVVYGAPLEDPSKSKMLADWWSE